MSADSEILTQLTEAVSKLTNNALSTTKIQAVAVKLPEFWTDDPEIWFLRAEAQFRSKSIIIDQTKFDYIITALDDRAAAEVKAVLLNQWFPTFYCLWPPFKSSQHSWPPA